MQSTNKNEGTLSILYTLASFSFKISSNLYTICCSSVIQLKFISSLCKVQEGLHLHSIFILNIIHLRGFLISVHLLDDKKLFIAVLKPLCSLRTNHKYKDRTRQQRAWLHRSLDFSKALNVHARWSSVFKSTAHTGKIKCNWFLPEKDLRPKLLHWVSGEVHGRCSIWVTSKKSKMHVVSPNI